MSDNSLQTVASTGAALNVEHYQTFEIAKANDDILGGDNIEQLRSYGAYARAQSQAIYKTLAATNTLDEASAMRAETIEIAQTFAKVDLFASQRIGELLRELPTRQGKRTDTTSCVTTQEVTKSEAIANAGIDSRTAYDLQALAANPAIVEAVIAKAEAEGRLVSRKQALDAISEKKRAEQQRDEALDELEEAYHSAELMEAEVASLRRQVAEKPQPEVVEREVVREVVPSDYQAAKMRVADLEHLERIHSDDNKELRRQIEEMRTELDRAKDVLGMDKSLQDVRRDVQYLLSATINYVRKYGGLTWTAQQFAEIDSETLEQLRLAVTNLATFSSTLLEHLNHARK